MDKIKLEIPVKIRYEGFLMIFEKKNLKKIIFGEVFAFLFQFCVEDQTHHEADFVCFSTESSYKLAEF